MKYNEVKFWKFCMKAHKLLQPGDTEILRVFESQEINPRISTTNSGAISAIPLLLLQRKLRPGHMEFPPDFHR